MGLPTYNAWLIFGNGVSEISFHPVTGSAYVNKIRIGFPAERRCPDVDKLGLHYLVMPSGSEATTVRSNEVYDFGKAGGHHLLDDAELADPVALVDYGEIGRAHV